MNDKQRRRYERLARSRDVATTHSADLPGNSIGGKALTNISSGVAEIETLDAARSTSERDYRHATSIKRDKRVSLQRLLTVISETAATIALDFPELKDRFRRPRANLNDQNMLTTARSFHTEATPLRSRFVEYGLPENFLDTLNALIEEFEQAANQQNVGKGGRRASIVAIDAALAATEQELERLDTAFRNKFAGDAATLAAWDAASRLQSAPKQARKKPEQPK
ncbi:MAG TPA: hypothetical protein VGC89_02490 [Pyrinomonadaceae bacterium]|jgi:hypothetical protein